jgi:ribonuclease HI
MENTEDIINDNIDSNIIHELCDILPESFNNKKRKLEIMVDNVEDINDKEECMLTINNITTGITEDGKKRKKRKEIRKIELKNRPISDIIPHGKRMFEFYSRWRNRNDNLSIPMDPDNKHHIHAFTDGSYRVDGDNYGVGIYFLHDQLAPHSESFKGYGGESNEAELYAIMRCLQLIPMNRKCMVYTDSDYAYSLIMNGIGKRRPNDHVIKVYTEIMKLINNRSPTKTYFKNVQGHCKRNDGNYHADILAKIASANPTLNILKLCEKEYLEMIISSSKSTVTQPSLLAATTTTTTTTTLPSMVIVNE